MSVFISYSHRQGEWVWDRLVPCLQAGGVEVLIDRERFVAGRGVVGQMDATQDTADRHVLVFSPEYLASDMCRHEMERAIALDPRFEAGKVVPVVRVDCVLPDAIRNPDPLYVDMRDDARNDAWNLLLQALNANLGSTALDWFAARDATVRALKHPRSVNLVSGAGTAWRALIEHIRKQHLPEMGRVDLENPITYRSRNRVVQEMLAACGIAVTISGDQDDLVVLSETLKRRNKPIYLALTHFHLIADRPYYDTDLFHALRFLIMEERKMLLIVQSREQSFSELLPRDHPLSKINMEVIELLAHR